MFDTILSAISDFVWGIPTIVLILATGILLTVRMRGLQFRKLGLGFRTMFRKTGGKGEVTPFQALCTALSATIGTGNIIGVATAIAGGGPGALFWMWVAALVGTATKYTECMLAVKYREHTPDGHILGGPFYTIEKGMKEKTGFSWKWLAVMFAVFGVCVGLFGIGTFTQINGITSAVGNAVDPGDFFQFFRGHFRDFFRFFSIHFQKSTSKTLAVMERVVSAEMKHFPSSKKQMPSVWQVTN